MAGRLRVNLAGAVHGRGGIGRYGAELRPRLADRVEYVPCTVDAAGLSGVPLLRQLPLALRGADPSAPVHFPLIVGSGVLLFRRLPPSVVTAHDLGPLHWPPEARSMPPAARVFLLLAFAALRRADRVIADSHFTARALVERLGIRPERVSVVWLGVDHATFRPEPDARRRAAERLGIDGWEQWRTLLVVGSELPRKNVGAVLESVRAFKQRGERVRLVKAGSSGGARWRARTAAMAAQLGVVDRVRFFDDASDADLALLYGAADAYVSASKLEGFSLPAIEAMACGAPTVVASSGSLPEVVGDGGLLLRSATSAALTDALARLFTDPGLAARLRDAATRRAANFDWARTADETFETYRALLA